MFYCDACSGMPAKPTTITFPSLRGARMWVLAWVRLTVCTGSWSGTEVMMLEENRSRSVRSPFSSPYSKLSSQETRPEVG